MRRPWRARVRHAGEAAPIAADGTLETPAASRSPSRCFFIHVMKTGGTTLFQHLRANFTRDELYPHRDFDIRYDGTFRHLEVDYLLAVPPERRERIRVYTGHFPYVACELLGEPFMTMTILRDPVERTISLLQQFRREVPWIGPNAPSGKRREHQTLEETYADSAIFEAFVHDHQTKLFSMTAADHPRSYRQPILVDESRLALAKENLGRVDVVGLTETYGDFLDDLERQFGWKVPRRDLRANVTPPEADLEPVSDSLRRHIAEDNAIDIEFYEYAKQLVARRRLGSSERAES